MTKIEPCPCCGGEMNLSTYFWECENKGCFYEVFSRANRIEEHNDLSRKVQRVEQLERFAKLATPVIEWVKERGQKGEQLYTDCVTALASLPEKNPQTFDGPEIMKKNISEDNAAAESQELS